MTWELILRIAVSLFLGGSVFTLIWALFRYPVPIETAVNRRVALALGTGQRQTVFEQPVLTPIMGMMLNLAKRMNLPAVRNLIRRDLEASGNPNAYSIEEYLGVCLLCSLGLMVFAAGILLLFVQEVDPLLMVVMLLIGFGLPLYTLHSQAESRLTRIGKQLPYTLDLIALTMASGSTFSEAIETIIRDNPEDDLNQELKIVQAEIEFGTKRATALENMAARIPIDALRSVVGATNQAEQLGTPLSAILKSQSSMLRMHRSVRAEKLSASASLRILIPSMLILLAVVMLIFGPMLLRWRQEGMF